MTQQYFDPEDLSRTSNVTNESARLLLNSDINSGASIGIEFRLFSREPVGVHECCSDIEMQQFVDARSRLSADKLFYLTEYSVAEYKELAGTRLYLTDCQRAGYAISGDGELMSVFALAGSRLGGVVLAHAVENSNLAWHLYCYDREGFLPRLYNSFGFVEVERAPFDPQYAPAGWDILRDGTPDYVKMVRLCHIV
jgi:hypothetical protein